MTPPPMTPERWRAVDAILQAALACEPERRAAVVADACDGDPALRIEVTSLLAAHVDATDGFLEPPAAVALSTSPLAEALAAAFAMRLAKAIEGRYVIEREIARGGMATVYLARDLRHDRHVAIKVLREELAAAVGADRFLAEIRVTASLLHPHILPLFDSGSADGLLWYAMPFVEGETLRAYLARVGSLPVAEAVRLAREVADALDHAHSRGIIHRDVKPENVLLQDGHALVADFGIALALEQAGGERITRTGLALGTPQYMAPEQASGERVLDARVDVYALGAVLHEMIAGAPPFAAPTRQAVVRRMIHELPAGLTTLRPEVTRGVDAAVQKALAKRPDDRFPSAVAFAAALVAPLENVNSTVTAPKRERGRTVSARWAMYAAVATLVVGVVGGRFVDPSALIKRWTAAAHTTNNAVEPPPLATAGDVDPPLVVVDRTGRQLREIPGTRPWTPRFSPDGHRVAYGAFGPGRKTSDLWVTDVDAGTTKRLTDDDADANDPQWSANGTAVAFSESAAGGKDVAIQKLAGGTAQLVAARDGVQFPSDWSRDGSALLVTEDAGSNQRDILVQPADGSPARPYVATAADEMGARFSPDGHWVAYSSDVSGRAEVYVDSYPKPGHRRMLSSGGGIHPVWRGDGRELYYWRDGALVSVGLGAAVAGAPPVPGEQTVLFRAPYKFGLNTMYDVSPDGQRFVIVRQR